MNRFRVKSRVLYEHVVGNGGISSPRAAHGPHHRPNLELKPDLRRRNTHLITVVAIEKNRYSCLCRCIVQSFPPVRIHISATISTTSLRPLFKPTNPGFSSDLETKPLLSLVPPGLSIVSRALSPSSDHRNHNGRVNHPRHKRSRPSLLLARIRRTVWIHVTVV